MNKESIVGNLYITSHSVTFRVLGVVIYHGNKVSKQYKDILVFKPGYLVAIKYRTALIPNITVSEGVFRLTKVEIDGKIIATPLAISKALGIDECMKDYPLQQVV